MQEPFLAEDQMMDQLKHIAMASEMFHTASLVHDDIIDKSDTRRSKESINARWGQKRSVVSGDYIVAMANRLLSTNRDPQVITVEWIFHF